MKAVLLQKVLVEGDKGTDVEKELSIQLFDFGPVKGVADVDYSECGEVMRDRFAGLQGQLIPPRKPRFWFFVHGEGARKDVGVLRIAVVVLVLGEGGGCGRWPLRERNFVSIVG